MARYGNFNINRKKRPNRLLVAALCALAAILILLFIIGVTAGSDGEKMAKMSTAVRENTELKAQISELMEEIDRLNAENADLKAQLDAMPAPAPESTELPDTTQTQTYNEPQSPREGFR